MTVQFMGVCIMLHFHSNADILVFIAFVLCFATNEEKKNV